MKINIFEQITVQDTFLTQLDPIWPPKRGSRGAQDEPKTDPKRVQNGIQNRSEKIIAKWTAQGSMAGFGGGHSEPRGPPGGRQGGGSIESTKDPYPRSSTPMGRWPGEFYYSIARISTSGFLTEFVFFYRFIEDAWMIWGFIC